jgi:hypothetical protein
LSLYHPCLLGLWNWHTLVVLCVSTVRHFIDCLCGLVVRVLGYRSVGPGSIPGTTRFSGGGGGKGKN